MNWKKVKLTDVCKPKQWKTISASELKEEGYPVYGANGKIGFYNEYTHEKETILITCRGATCGTLNICEPKSYVNGNAMALDNLIEECHLKFLFYFFQKRGFNDVISGSAQPQITGQGLSKVELPLPDLTTQKHIAEVLDKADAIRQQNRQLLAQYDELLQSTFIELFGDPVKNPKGWEVRRLEELCENIIDCPHSTPNHKSEITEFPSIRTTEIKNGTIDWSSMKYVEFDEYNERTKRLIPQENDIVYGREGSFGDAILIPKNTKMCLGQRVMLFRVKREICNSIFFWALIRSDYVYNQAVKKTSGSTVGHINVKDIKLFNVVLPPLSLQQHFAKIVIQIEAQKEQVKLALAESEALFEGLLAKYFG